MWYIIRHTKTKIIARVHMCTRHTAHGTRADFFFGMYQLETRFARIKNKIRSSTEEQSSAIIVHKPRRTATSTRTTRTRQNNPYRLGAAPAGAIGPRVRCCPAATVPVAVVFACGVCCCIAENKQKKQTKYNHQPKNRALPSSSTNQSAQQRVLEQYTQGRTSPTGLARRRK